MRKFWQYIFINPPKYLLVIYTTIGVLAVGWAVDFRWPISF